MLGYLHSRADSRNDSRPSLSLATAIRCRSHASSSTFSQVSVIDLAYDNGTRQANTAGSAIYGSFSPSDMLNGRREVYKIWRLMEHNESSTASAGQADKLQPYRRTMSAAQRRQLHDAAFLRSFLAPRYMDPKKDASPLHHNSSSVDKPQIVQELPTRFFTEIFAELIENHPFLARFSQRGKRETDHVAKAASAHLDGLDDALRDMPIGSIFVWEKATRPSSECDDTGPWPPKETREVDKHDIWAIDWTLKTELAAPIPSTVDLSLLSTLVSKYENGEDYVDVVIGTALHRAAENPGEFQAAIDKTLLELVRSHPNASISLPSLLPVFLFVGANPIASVQGQSVFEIALHRPTIHLSIALVEAIWNRGLLTDVEFQDAVTNLNDGVFRFGSFEAVVRDRLPQGSDFFLVNTLCLRHVSPDETFWRAFLSHNNFRVRPKRGFRDLIMELAQAYPSGRCYQDDQPWFPGVELARQVEWNIPGKEMPSHGQSSFYASTYASSDGASRAWTDWN